MERKHHKHRRSHSPHDFESHKKKKSYKRHQSDSSSAEEEDINKKKHHKHRHIKEKERQRHHSGSDEDNNHDQGWKEGEASNNHRHHRPESGENGSKRRERGGGRDRDGHKRDKDSRGSEERGSRHHRHRPRRGSAEFDPAIRIKQEKDDRNFQEQQRERRGRDQERREARRGRDRAGGDHGLNTDAPRVKEEPGAGPDNPENSENSAPDRQEPNFELSGKLTEDTNTFRGVVIKYNEPPEAMKPKRRWRLYPFKGQESLPVLHIHRQSAFLLGRDRRIADIPVDHPSCSKQQAVLQFRAMPYERPDGTPGRRVRPYIIDLESANGTYLNGEKMDARRYYELKEKDVIKFGFSSREYVVLHDAVDVSEVAAGEDMEEA